MKPTLIIMAAGMGSRYGGLKQIDPITDKGEIILDFSLYDAMMAGFEDVIFIIKKENLEDFKELIDERAGKHMNVSYCFQELDNIPKGTKIPEGRVKPWGTGHAVLSAKNLVKGPFAVINADDYYGSGAFQSIYDFLEKAQKGEYCMAGYYLKNTITENGSVSRGVCTMDENNLLTDVTERTKIQRLDTGKIGFTEDDKNWETLDDNTIVSMNFWGFTGEMMDELEKGFKNFMENLPKEKEEKGEFQLPAEVDKLIKEGKATAKVLPSPDRWYGVTYKEDKPEVMDALQAMKDKGFYPDKLFK